MTLWKRELNGFWLALGFLTRIPMPQGVVYSDQALDHACRYFSLVGWLVGGLLALLWVILAQWFDASLTALLVLAASLRLTGVFHEDGLADTADGLGGGFTPEQKLSIMKDSRIGSYGAAALIMGLLLRWQALVSLGSLAPWALLVSGAASRAFSTALMLFLPYCRRDEESKSKPLVTRADPRDIAWCVTIATLPVLLTAPTLAVTLLLALSLLGLWLVSYYRRSLGGYTGDLLGAAQQLSEIILLLACLLFMAGASGTET